jgi:hypothetical protein
MAHAHDDHETFDGEPAKTLSPGEPQTPGWLPLVGLALFTALGIALLAGAGGGDQASGAVTTKPAEAPASPPPVQAQAVPQSPQPAGTGALHKLSSAQIEGLKKKIEEAKAKGALPNNAGQPQGH